MLTNRPAEATDHYNPDLLDPTSVWAHRVKKEAVLVIAQIGDAPEQLHYRHCHHEGRRQLLLQSRVCEEYKQPGLVQVMRVALKLANSGSMPGPGEHGRKSDFIKRCAAALQALAPEEETDLKKLSVEDQVLARRILGGDTSVPYNGCLNQDCLDEEATWVVDKVLKDVSRCARCNFLKCYGRTVHNTHDVMRPMMNRQKVAENRFWWV